MQGQGIDTRAILSLITGIAAFMFLGSYAWSLAAPILGAIAVGSGYMVLRTGRTGKGLSVGGLVLGTIAICGWLLSKING